MKIFSFGIYFLIVHHESSVFSQVLEYYIHIYIYEISFLEMFCPQPYYFPVWLLVLEPGLNLYFWGNQILIDFTNKMSFYNVQRLIYYVMCIIRHLCFIIVLIILSSWHGKLSLTPRNWYQSSCCKMILRGTWTYRRPVYLNKIFVNTSFIHAEVG